MKNEVVRIESVGKYWRAGHPSSEDQYEAEPTSRHAYWAVTLRRDSLEFHYPWVDKLPVVAGGSPDT